MDFYYCVSRHNQRPNPLDWIHHKIRWCIRSPIREYSSNSFLWVIDCVDRVIVNLLSILPNFSCYRRTRIPDYVAPRQPLLDSHDRHVFLSPITKYSFLSRCRQLTDGGKAVRVLFTGHNVGLIGHWRNGVAYRRLHGKRRTVCALRVLHVKTISGGAAWAYVTFGNRIDRVESTRRNETKRVIRLSFSRFRVKIQTVRTTDRRENASIASRTTCAARSTRFRDRSFNVKVIAVIDVKFWKTAIAIHVIIRTAFRVYFRQ